MNGASTDGTINIVQSFDDSRIRVFSEKDKGVYDAMNKEIKRTKGEWLYFLGNDISWMIKMLNINYPPERYCCLDCVPGDIFVPPAIRKCPFRWRVLQ